MFFSLAITAAQTADTTSIFRTIAIVGYILAAICFVLSIAIFFLYDIKGAYAYLSGRKQQKGISEMRRHQNDEKNGEFPASPSMKFGHSESPKARTDKKNSASLKKQAAPIVVPPPVPSIKEQPKEQPSYQGDETAALGSALEDSGFDSEGETGVLSPTNDAQSTAENSAAENETSVLNVSSQFGTFILVKNEMLIHTNEIL